MQELKCLFTKLHRMSYNQNTANLFWLSEAGYLHQIKQPTNILEQRLAAEGGIAAVVTASGTPAITTALLVLLKNRWSSSFQVVYTEGHLTYCKLLCHDLNNNHFCWSVRSIKFYQCSKWKHKSFFYWEFRQPKVRCIDIQAIAAEAKVAYSSNGG
jgi:O-acetylhomoserine (thiol)-lyase